MLRGVIVCLFFWDLSRSENFSEMKPPLSMYIMTNKIEIFVSNFVTLFEYIWTLPCFFRVLLHQFFINISWNLKFKSKERCLRNNFNQLCMEDRKKKLVFQPNEFCQPFHFPDCFSLFSRYSLFPTAPQGRRKVQKLERA